jgi:hypothetical protein
LVTVSTVGEFSGNLGRTYRRTARIFLFSFGLLISSRDRTCAFQKRQHAMKGPANLWKPTRRFAGAVGALTAKAVQRTKAGLNAIYQSGWEINPQCWLIQPWPGATLYGAFDGNARHGKDIGTVNRDIESNAAN